MAKIFKILKRFGQIVIINTALEISTKFIHHSGENSKAQHLNKYDENICEQMMDSIVVVEIQISKHRKGKFTI